MERRLTHLAKNLRVASTDAERLFWRRTRSRQCAGLKFRRQQEIGSYIVDFVCFEAKLIVELDGGQHLENVLDQSRDAYLESLGFRVLRFWNNETLNNIEGVMQRVMGVAEGRI